MESLLERSNIARQKGRYWRRIRNITVFILLFGFFVWGYIRYYYPIEEGIETGELKQVVYQGSIFKTYEGKLTRSEVKASKDGSLPSNEFEFSVAKKSIAVKLTHAGDKTVELHYKKYFSAISWRGKSRYIIVNIVNISDDKDSLDIKNIVDDPNGLVLNMKDVVDNFDRLKVIDFKDFQ